MGRIVYFSHGDKLPYTKSAWPATLMTSVLSLSLPGEINKRFLFTLTFALPSPAPLILVKEYLPVIEFLVCARHMKL